MANRTNSKRATLAALVITTAAALAAASSGFSASTASAQTASASSGCSGVTVSPSSRTVRRGGRVLLTGRACTSGASSASGGSVRINLQKGKRWASVASASADSNGDFRVCAPVRVPAGTRVARLQAASPDGASGTVAVQVSSKGSNTCSTGGNTGGGSTSGGGQGSSTQETQIPQNPQDPPPNADCPLAQSGSTISMNLPTACTTVASDTASNPDPTSFWDRIECQDPTRHQQIGSGGDPHATGTGTSQGNGAFRRMTVQDGDNFYGERCELGHNNMNAPTAFYHEGQRRVTYISLRLGSNVNPAGQDWRTVMQMKQAQPYNNPNTSPVFELQVVDGKWAVQSSWNNIWNAPAQAGVWTRFAFDMVYSQDPNVGSVTTYVDLNGDGDFSDANEKSPLIHVATLRAETQAGYPSPWQPGDSIPSHLRAGIYQNAAYNCPGGCSVDIDNVQVVRA